MTLGVTSFLALSFQLGSSNSHLPRYSSLKCMDIWLIACIVFIFLSLVEFTVVCYISQRHRAQNLATTTIVAWRYSILAKKRAANTGTPLAQAHMASKRGKKPKNKGEKPEWLKFDANDLDKISLWLFPMFFLAFNCCYWVYFLFM